MKLCLQSTVSRWFSFLGRTVGNKPAWFIILPIIISISLSTGFIKLAFNRNLDELITAVNSRAVQERKLVENLFGRSELPFDTTARQTKAFNMAIIEVIPKDKDSIFRKNIFQDLLTLDHIVTTFSITWKGKPLNYSTICGKMNDKCVRNNVLELASYLKSDGLEKHSVKYPIDMNNVTFVFKEYVLSLGGIETNDEGYIVDGKAARLMYLFRRHSKWIAIKQWLKGLNRYLESIRFDHIEYVFFNYARAEDEMAMMSEMLLPNIPIVICAMAVFAFLSCMTNSLIRSKPLVGVSSSLSAILATLSGFGLCVQVGVPFTDFHLILAFTVLAVEVDDAFILIAAWRKSSPRNNVVERMKESYSGTGISITITSITNVISYCIGILTPFPVIRYICIYAAVTTLFSYIYLITFFGGCLALDGYREERGQLPLTFFCGKGVQESSFRESEEANEEEFFMKKFRIVLGSALSYPEVKITIIILFLINLCLGCWGLNYIVCGSDLPDMFGDNAKTNQAMKWNYRYFSAYSYPIHVIIDYPLDYSDPKIQMSIEKLMRKLEAHPHIAESSLRMSWLKYYKMFANSLAGRFSLRGYNMSSKVDFVDGLHNIFLNIHRAKEFREDIVFNENFTDIVASRFIIPTKHITDQSIEVQIQDYVHKVADQSPIPVRVFSMNFHLIEQAQLIKSTTLMTAIVSSCLILLVFIVFVRNIICSLCISTVVICMFCETVGYMSLWGVNLDICSLITLIVCVGFSINYPTHISFSYVNSEDTNREDKVNKAMYEVGMPIFQGSVSTILGIIVLAFKNYYNVRSVFKVIFIITLQTAFHSLFFILVLLSEFQKCSLSFRRRSKQSETDVQSLRENDNTNEGI